MADTTNIKTKSEVPTAADSKSAGVGTKDIRAEDDFSVVAPREEHINEVAFQMDEPILDPNHELAVQVPEGVGADGTDVQISLANALTQGTAESLFKSGKADTTTGRDKADL